MKITYRVVRSDRKTLGLVVKDSQEVLVRAPHRMGVQEIEEVLHRNQDWITVRVEKVLEEESRRKRFQDSGLFIFGGREYPMKRIPGDAVYLEDGVFHIGGSADLDGFYRETMERLVKELVERYRGIGVPSKLSYRRQKTLWGSCARDGSVSLNLLLAKSPLGVLEYVYVHELVHLRIRDHSPAFWAEVETLLPGYKPLRRWLKKNGPLLFL